MTSRVGVEHWYYGDVETNSPSPFAREPGMHQISSIDQLIKIAEGVDQFQRGVFVASPHATPRFRPNLNTEDPEFADLGDADIEIRAFDTTYFELYVRDEELARDLAERFRVEPQSHAEFA